MAAIGVALYKYVMKYSPKNCNYFNRDRFVLSNGMFKSIQSKLSGCHRSALTDAHDQATHASGNTFSCILLAWRV